VGMRDANNRLTICEVLRHINDRVQGEEHSDVRDMLALAEQMAKRMSKKLLEYNHELDDSWWKENADFDRTMIRMMKTHLVGDADRARAMLEK